MLKRIFSIKIIIIITLLTFLLDGCNIEPSTTVSMVSTATNDCSDTKMTGVSIVVSSAMDVEGKPINVGTVFPFDTQVLYCTISLPWDLCCTDVYISWQSGTDIEQIWVYNGSTFPNLFTQLLARPSSGYTWNTNIIKIYIGANEVARALFYFV
ncbi:MAG: hypothetical protein ACRKGH_07670 [Dehalogenimonas sp.]